MMLLTKAIRAKLLANGRKSAENGDGDFEPVVKLFNPAGAATWLLTELDPDNEDIAFGLADLGFGTPELGSVSISELAAFRGRLGLGIERDRYFTADKRLSEYADEARKAGRISA
jgi:hypothetical protein